MGEARKTEEGVGEGEEKWEGEGRMFTTGNEYDILGLEGEGRRKRQNGPQATEGEGKKATARRSQLLFCFSFFRESSQLGWGWE